MANIRLQFVNDERRPVQQHSVQRSGTWTADGSLLLMSWGHWKVFEL
ncbi:hypothetical protein MKX70_24670 [Paenibacillus sp. FSL R7-0312]|nr:hypothetical protein [Paenibacillus sp. FSL R5-0912]